MGRPATREGVKNHREGIELLIFSKIESFSVEIDFLNFFRDDGWMDGGREGWRDGFYHTA